MVAKVEAHRGLHNLDRRVDLEDGSHFPGLPASLSAVLAERPLLRNVRCVVYEIPRPVRITFHGKPSKRVVTQCLYRFGARCGCG